MLIRLLLTLCWVVLRPVRWLVAALGRLAFGSSAVVVARVQAIDDLRARTTWLDDLRALADDGAVEAVWLQLDGSPGGWGAAWDLRQAVQALRGAATRVVVSLETPGTADLFVASAADRVVLLPTGQLDLLGLGAQLVFFKRALDRLGARADLEAAGAYKSFGEPYTRTYASSANQEATRELLGDVQDQVVAAVARDRGLEPGEVVAAIADAPLSAEVAVDRGLIDALAYDDEVRGWLREQHGDDVRFVGFSGWRRLRAVVRWLDALADPPPPVAVVHLQGGIVTDDAGRGVAIRARKVAPVLRALRADDTVKAVVLHVSSPGGSALASDVIWREVERLGREKPVVAAFEDVAASGGYYLSAPAVHMVARPTTITGSIGVFGGKIVVDGVLRKIGVTVHDVGGAPNAHVYSPFQPFDDAQRARFRASLQRTYDGFVQRVAAGRRRPVREVEPHCRGRVWTGEMAIARGLVDALGGLDTAIARSVTLSGASSSAVRHLEPGPRATVLQRIVRSAVPFSAHGAGSTRWPDELMALWRLTRWVGGSIGPVADAVQLVADHPVQPLALWPDAISPRRPGGSA